MVSGDAGAAMPDASPEKSTSLHARILDEVRLRIISGEWPPGHRIPSELDLTREYGCSRMTVNRALTQLARAGLIERRRRAGSVVSRPRSQSALLEIHDIQTEVESLGQLYRYELLDRRVRSGDSGERNWEDLEPLTPVLELTCRHFAGEQPFCFEQRSVSLAAVPDAERVDFAEIAPSVWLLQEVPWSAAEHRISAAGASDGESRALQIPRNTACLVVERRTWNAGQPVTLVRLIYPGGTHSVKARFTPAVTNG